MEEEVDWRRTLAGLISPCTQPKSWRNASPLINPSAISAHCVLPTTGSHIVLVVKLARVLARADFACVAKVNG